MLIECPYCVARVDATVIAAHEDEEQIDMSNLRDEPPPGYDPELDEGILPYRATMLVCVICHNVLLAVQKNNDRASWSEPKRVYPPQGLQVPYQIPRAIRDSLEEAARCLNANSYSATAVMCRRAVEGVCRHYGVAVPLGPGLNELRKREIIDGMLLQWAEALRLHGNRGAHPDPAAISEEDAVDLFDFAVAICDYVFVLSDKFRKFKQRTDPGGKWMATVQ